MKKKSQATVSKYRSEFDYCEACAKLEGSYPVRTTLEVHHIIGGIDRTDEVWNIITICREHHIRATYHNLQYGVGAKGWNKRFVALKILKGEMTEDGFNIFGFHIPEIDKLVDEMKDSKFYRYGKQLGWYEK